MPEQSAGGSLKQSAPQPDVERPADQAPGAPGAAGPVVAAGADPGGPAGRSRHQPVPQTRVDLPIGPAIDGWRRALAGSGMPDTLLASGPNATASWLDVTHAHPSGLAQLFAGRQTRLSSLFREHGSHAAAWRQARAIRASALVLSAQRGVQGCCLSIGVATWLPDGASGPDAPVRAPVVLRGCTVRPRGAGNEDFDFELDDAVLINPELVRELVDTYEIPADGAHLAGLAHGPKGFDPRPVYAWLEEHCEEVPGFAIERSLVLATFAAGSGAVLADLDAAVPAITRHRLLGPVARSLVPTVLDLDGTGGAESPSDDDDERRTGTDLDVLTVGSAAETAHPADPADPANPVDPAGPDQVGPVQVLAPGQLTQGETRRLAMVGRLGPRGQRPVQPPAEADPAHDLLVLDLDPAQRSAVDAVLRGDDVLIEGPPGSGVTHTVAAAVARLVAAGRTVLVLSPRRASTEALFAQLETAGVADLVLDLRDSPNGKAASSPAILLRALESASGPVAALPRPGRDAPVDPGVETIRRSRQLLDDEVAALHEIREPWGVSVYDAMVALAELSGRPQPPGSPVRLHAEVLRGLDAVTRERLRLHLQAASAAGAFTLSRDDTRWYDASVATAPAARAALEAALILRSGLERARNAMDSVTAAAGLHPAHHAAGWLPLLDLMLGVRLTVDSMQPHVFEHDLDLLVSAVAPRGRRAEAGLELGRAERRRVRRQAQALVRPGVHVPDLYSMLRAARDQKVRWVELAILPELPRVVVGLSEAEAAVRRAMSALDVLADVFGASSNADPRMIPLDDLELRVHDLAGDQDGILGQPRRATLVDGLRRAGLGSVVDDFRSRRVLPESVDAELDQLWWGSVRDVVVASDGRLSRHDPVTSRREAERLRAGVEAQIVAGAGMVRTAATVRAAKVVAQQPDQVAVLRSELARDDRRPRLVDLVRQCGDVLAGLAPIWLMNPDTVAACLAPADPDLPPLVDTVVVDDAGYIGLPEVVAALARGAQVVVAGDRHRQNGSGDSVAEVVAPFATVCRLDRDHRAVDGRMLLPLVAHYREGWQLTPGIEALPPLALESVIDGIAVPPPGEELPTSADAEVNRVVELVEAHAVNRPEESCVVVTLSERHAERIEQALRVQVTERPALARWLARQWQDDIAEPFLVRPVQRALGVERDAAIVAIGLARTPHGRVLHRFGPLDEVNGASGLIAALSRSRLRTTVVCCFTAEDLVVDRLRTPGGRLLRDVLLAAGRRNPSRAGRSAKGADGLVTDLRSRLVAAGLPVHARVGDRGWPLDVGIEDPRTPGRMLVGIDMDGPGFAARACGERERLRPLRWERAGWTYRKISALDYFADPALEVERVRLAWEEAMARPEVDDFGPPPWSPSGFAAVAGTPVPVDEAEPVGEAEVPPVVEPAVVEAPVVESAVAVVEPAVAVVEPAVAVVEPAVARVDVVDSFDSGPMVDPDPPEPDSEEPISPVPVDGELPSEGMDDDIQETGTSADPGDDERAAPEQTRDDTDEGWGESRSDDRDEEILRERPPHWD